MIKNQIIKALNPEVLNWLSSLECFSVLNSTNSYLINATPPPEDKANFCMAQIQSAARGRSGKQWLTPEGGIAFSLAFWTTRSWQDLTGLPLCVGVSIAHALETLGIKGVQIKWPNDVWIHSAKVGGILTEIAAHTGDATLIVLGIGMNESPIPQDTFSYPVADIKTYLPAEKQEQWSKAAWIALLLQHLYTDILFFESKGLSHFQSQWPQYDALKGQRISAVSATTGKAIQGIACGISDKGFLRLISDAGEEELIHDASVQRL